MGGGGEHTNKGMGKLVGTEVHGGTLGEPYEKLGDTHRTPIPEEG